MTPDRKRQAEASQPTTDTNIPRILVTEEPGGRSTVTAILMIGGRRAELRLADWLDPAAGDTDAAARTALSRAALSFLEGLEP